MNNQYSNIGNRSILLAFYNGIKVLIKVRFVK